MRKILVVHGPNLNLLGERQTEIYGTMTLAELNGTILAGAQKRDVEVIFFQSNHEGSLIDFLHEHRRTADGIVINPGALAHYSYALRDGLAAVRLPSVEVHLTDINKREPFRKTSVLREVCLTQICGHGLNSYLQGVDWLAGHWLDAEFAEFLQTTPAIEEAYRQCVKLLKRDFPKYDWVGIYVVEGNELVLHNFIGAPSPHTRIPIGRGICGAAAAEGQTILVPNVRADARYLACSIETKSEIVVPIKGERIYAEIDIDSHTIAAFHEGDQATLENLAARLADYLAGR